MSINFRLIIKHIFNDFICWFYAVLSLRGHAARWLGSVAFCPGQLVAPPGAGGRVQPAPGRAERLRSAPHAAHSRAYLASNSAPLYCFSLSLPPFIVMRAPPSFASPHQNASPALTSINLDAVDAQQLARTLAQAAGRPRPQLLIDCGQLQCRRTLGVSHVVSQLLVLRRSGADIWLRNVDPVLHHCLHLLRLDQLFFLTE